MYEIGNETKRIQTAQPFLVGILFTIQLFRMEQIYTFFCSFTLLILNS